MATLSREHVGFRRHDSRATNVKFIRLIKFNGKMLETVTLTNVIKNFPDAPPTLLNA